LQISWERRNEFSVGHNCFGWDVENGTIFIVGGRVDSRSLECAADIYSVSAERVVRGCQSRSDADNAEMQGRQDNARTPWRLVGKLQKTMCIFAHCVVTLPVAAATSVKKQQVLPGHLLDQRSDPATHCTLQLPLK
jgi:hypothetical protein